METKTILTGNNTKCCYKTTEVPEDKHAVKERALMPRPRGAL